MTESTVPTCALCEVPLRNSFSAREGMFGLGGSFYYASCPECKMMSQVDPPADLSPYYPENYYSFTTEIGIPPRHSFFRLWLANARNDSQIFGKPSWARPLVRYLPSRFVSDITPYLKHTARHKGKALEILDVGCGGGGLLRRLASLGFTRLNGVDPYIPTSDTIGAVRLRRVDHTSLINEQFDLIMLNHSLEHMRDQLAAVGVLGRLLTEVGVARIEVPVSDSDAFAEYGPHWAELDPPRHLYLHSRRSLQLLAERCGLQVIEMEEFGGAFEFWGSELLRRGITMYDSQKSRFRSEADYFSGAESAVFQARAARAKTRLKSGRVAIYLRRSN